MEWLTGKATTPQKSVVTPNTTRRSSLKKEAISKAKERNPMIAMTMPRYAWPLLGKSGFLQNRYEAHSSARPTAR